MNKQDIIELYNAQISYYDGDAVKAWKSLSKESQLLIKEFKPKKTAKAKKSAYWNKVWKLSNENAINVEGISKRKWKEYDLDHIVPIKYGYDNNIPAELIASVDNLRVIPHKDNYTKGTRLIEEAVSILNKWK